MMPIEFIGVISWGLSNAPHFIVASETRGSSHKPPAPTTSEVSGLPSTNIFHTRNSMATCSFSQERHARGAYYRLEDFPHLHRFRHCHCITVTSMSKYKLSRASYNDVIALIDRYNCPVSREVSPVQIGLALLIADIGLMSRV